MSQAFQYNRVIKLPPALGDWTTIQLEDFADEDVSISPIMNVNFDHLPKAVINEVHEKHYRLALKVVSQLSDDLNMKIELHQVSVSQMCYEDFLNIQTEKVIQSDISLDSLANLSFIADWGLGEIMVNRLTGGRGEESHSESFSDIESDLIDIEIQNILPFFSDIWGITTAPEAVKHVFHSGAYRRNFAISMRDAYTVFRFDMGVDKSTLKSISLAYPNRDIKALIKASKKNKKVAEKIVYLPSAMLKKTQCEVVATLGNTQLTMAEIKHLEAGDIISLDETLSSPIKLTLSDKTVLQAQPGVKNNKISVQVISQPALETQQSLAPQQKEERQSEPDEVVSLDLSSIPLETSAEIDMEATSFPDPEQHIPIENDPLRTGGFQAPEEESFTDIDSTDQDAHMSFDEEDSEEDLFLESNKTDDLEIDEEEDDDDLEIDEDDQYDEDDEDDELPLEESEVETDIFDDGLEDDLEDNVEDELVDNDVDESAEPSQDSTVVVDDDVDFDMDDDLEVIENDAAQDQDDEKADTGIDDDDDDEDLFSSEAQAGEGDEFSWAEIEDEG